MTEAKIAVYGGVQGETDAADTVIVICANIEKDMVTEAVTELFN